MIIEDIRRIAIATKQFLELVESTKKPMYQGWDFIDYTLLCIHCEGFSKLTIDEAVELVRALGFIVLEAKEFSKEHDIVIEPTFALNASYDNDSLKERIDKYLDLEGEDE